MKSVDEVGNIAWRSLNLAFVPKPTVKKIKYSNKAMSSQIYKLAAYYKRVQPRIRGAPEGATAHYAWYKNIVNLAVSNSTAKPPN